MIAVWGHTEVGQISQHKGVCQPGGITSGLPVVQPESAESRMWATSQIGTSGLT